MKPTHDDIIDAKEVYIQMSFRRYKGKLEVLIDIFQLPRTLGFVRCSTP